MKTHKIILSFDLDYTLIDNTEGIIDSFKYALSKKNIRLISDEKIKSMIGIPLGNMFKKVTDEDSTTLAILFREYYAKKGIFKVKILPKVCSTIKCLYSEFELGVITSKEQNLAKKLLDYLDLSKFFKFIIGENENFKRKNDPNLRSYLLKSFPDYRYIFVGDHLKDRLLAEMMGSPFIGVLTGFHIKEELARNIKVKYKILNSVNEITNNLVLNLIKK